MRRNRLLILPLAAALAGGCNQAPPPVAAILADPGVPTAAQPKLDTIKLWLGPEQMTTEMALTEKQERTGMMFRTNMAENEGMIFVFDHPQQASFWMDNCVLPLSAAYMDTDGRILEIHDLQPHDTNLVLSATDDIEFVLETPQGWFQRHNIKTGTIVASEKGSLKKTFLGQ
jgi:uncharacterized membrane protein (UPF0127 family)